jgi:hypothetical protein
MVKLQLKNYCGPGRMATIYFQDCGCKITITRVTYFLAGSHVLSKRPYYKAGIPNTLKALLGCTMGVDDAGYGLADLRQCFTFW